MTPADVHPDDGIQLLLDGRLEPPRRAEVEAHLAACAACRRRRDLLAEARRLAGTLDRPPLPPGLETRVRSSLDAEGEVLHRRGMGRRYAGAAVSVAALVTLVSLVVVSSWRRVDIVSEAAHVYRDLSAGTLALDIENGDPALLREYFAAREVPSTVYDLAMMDFPLVGGRVHRIGGGSVALSLYRGSDGARLVCQMYWGRVDDLPVDATVLERDGITFRVYEREGTSLVFWQEGDVVCVLVSEIPRDRLVDLAVAKAGKAIAMAGKDGSGR